MPLAGDMARRYLPSMTSELDIYRAANLLVQHGAGEAPLVAAKRANAMLEHGDLEGQRVWKGVLRAVEELIRVERKPDEPINS
jgi:hypothetical protein